MAKVYRTEQSIRRIAEREDTTIEQKIEEMVAYIQDVSRYSYRNRYYATKFFMQWILQQNVRNIHVAELLQVVYIKAIDDDEVLNSYYDSREIFVVDFDDKLVDVKVEKGTVIFSLKGE